MSLEPLARIPTLRELTLESCEAPIPALPNLEVLNVCDSSRCIPDLSSFSTLHTLRLVQGPIGELPEIPQSVELLDLRSIKAPFPQHLIDHPRSKPLTVLISRDWLSRGEIATLRKHDIQVQFDTNPSARYGVDVADAGFDPDWTATTVKDIPRPWWW